MFELFGWSYIADAVSKLPKEITLTGIGALTFLEIHRRETNVKITKVNAEVRQAELHVEELKLKRELQKNGTNIETA